ncbi:hypothetical protein PF010_g2855 [Phytophthora fragariae]|uniref:Uncharacterized protein n=2 Tax=Phytophthora TaxID=4783 RepID=A0A6A3ZYS6_9STRA|nr:hypothetical protein PF003_g28234 [Phytophthora fragariae]KAE9047919.1 hypothetical protein PR002_g782 [Phytophthora rubi]KAE9022707.1 hypothetical protein PF011_g4335 [Phytophthora fragariae]KAE9133333.1 hypothetical protein PF010_g2855 [Phytophthora fragariae]KAE9247426.1 hypothetical protein PF002_g6281 [Phytophthora fragariae]
MFRAGEGCSGVLFASVGAPLLGDFAVSFGATTLSSSPRSQSSTSSSSFSMSSSSSESSSASLLELSIFLCNSTRFAFAFGLLFSGDGGFPTTGNGCR